MFSLSTEHKAEIVTIFTLNQGVKPQQVNFTLFHYRTPLGNQTQLILVD